MDNSASLSTPSHGGTAPGTLGTSHKLVIFASSLGTVFEWYDFYLYGSLAAIVGKQFFSGLNETSQFICALFAFAAGFAVRPFGALVFGRIGDLVGRKYTFMVTIVLMGLSNVHRRLSARLRLVPTVRRRLDCAHRPDCAPAHAGSRPGRRIRRRGDLRGRARPAGEARRLHLVDSDHGHPGPVPLPPRHPRLPHLSGRSGQPGGPEEHHEV